MKSARLETRGPITNLTTRHELPIQWNRNHIAVFTGDSDFGFVDGNDGVDLAEFFRNCCDGLDVFQGDRLVFREISGAGNTEVVQEVFA